MRGAPPVVVRDDKTLAGAFGMAFIGVALGIFGMHRYYLRQRIYGTMLSSVFLSGVLAVVHVYAGFVHQMLDAALAIGAGGSFAQVPDIQAIYRDPPMQIVIGLGLCGGGVAWLVLDLLMLPRAVKKYRMGLD